MTQISVQVVEDDAMIGTLLREMLEDLGYAVCAISVTEDDAVDDALRCKPDVMLVDMQLREGSGTEAMRRILRTAPVQHVYMSGAPLPSDGPVLRKPFLEVDLVRAIHLATGDMVASSPGATARPLLARMQD